MWDRRIQLCWRPTSRPRSGSSEGRGPVGGVPTVSAGVYGSEAADVARIAVAAVRGSPHLGELDLVRIVLSSPATHEAFVTALST